VHCAVLTRNAQNAVACAISMGGHSESNCDRWRAQVRMLYGIDTEKKCSEASDRAQCVYQCIARLAFCRNLPPPTRLSAKHAIDQIEFCIWLVRTLVGDCACSCVTTEVMSRHSNGQVTALECFEGTSNG
jgi:hypothetical protein